VAADSGPIDYQAVTQAQQVTWATGDFHEIARQNVVMAEALCTALDPHADAQALPFSDESFDAVLSVYGVQFAPDQEQAARELLRVCRPGGRIGLASPMPQGWSGDFFGVHRQHAPPPPGLQPPLRWGTEEGVSTLLGQGAGSIESRPCRALQYYRSVAHAVHVFSTYFGPTIRALDTVNADAQQQLRDDLEDLFTRYNRATDGTAVIENTYLETIMTRE
jgi:SAM-dependent methyltransferase